MNTAPEELVQSAVEAGFDLVSLWLNPAAAYPRQVVHTDGMAAVRDRLATTGIRVAQIEAFDLGSRDQVLAMRPYLAMGAQLGAGTVQVYNGTNPDRCQVVELLRLVCELAGEYGLGVNLEPVSMGQTRTLREAHRLIADTGVDAGIVLDLLHHMRTGGTTSDIAQMPHGFIRYVQINDGPLELPQMQWVHEAMAERLIPGEGGFPVTDLLRAAPPDVPWAIEAPNARRFAKQQEPVLQAKDAMAALRVILGELNLPN